MSARVQRVVLCVWLIGVPALILPWPMKPILWDSRDIQAAGLPILALIATALVWWTQRGPLRYFGLFLAYLGCNVAYHGFRPIWAASISGAICASILFVCYVSLSDAKKSIPSVLALTGVVHLLLFASGRLWVDIIEWIFFLGQPNPRPLGNSGLSDNPDLASAMLAMVLPWMLYWWIKTVLEPTYSLLASTIIFHVPLLMCPLAIWGFLHWRASGGVGALLLGLFVACVAWGVTSWKAGLLFVIPLGAYLAYDIPTGLRFVPWTWAVVEPFRQWTRAVFGYGLGSWSMFAAGKTRDLGIFYQQAHNDFLQVFFELGGIGLLLMLAVATSCFCAFWGQRKTTLGLCGLASLVAWGGASFWYFPNYTAALSPIGISLVLIAQECYKADH